MLSFIRVVLLLQHWCNLVVPPLHMFFISAVLRLHHWYALVALPLYKRRAFSRTNLSVKRFDGQKSVKRFRVNTIVSALQETLQETHYELEIWFTTVRLSPF